MNIEQTTAPSPATLTGAPTSAVEASLPPLAPRSSRVSGPSERKTPSVTKNGNHPHQGNLSPLIDRLALLADVYDMDGNNVPLSQLFPTFFGTSKYIGEESRSGYPGPDTKPLIHPQNGAKIIPSIHKGKLQLSGSPMMWLQGHDIYSRLTTSMIAGAYRMSIADVFQRQGLRIEFLTVSGLELMHDFDCGDPVTVCRLIDNIHKAREDAMELGHFRRDNYALDGFEWGEGRDKCRIDWWQGEHKYISNKDHADPAIMARRIRFRVYLSSSTLTRIFGRKRAPCFRDVDWQQVFVDHLAGLRVAGNPVQLTIDNLDRYPDLTKAEYGAVCQWILGGVPMKDSSVLRDKIWHKTKREIDIKCIPTFHSPWSSTEAWAFLRTRFASHIRPKL